MSKIDAIAKHGVDFVTRNSPAILTGVSVAGTITTAVLAAEATPKAIRLYQEATNEKGLNLTKPETVKACWKAYIPAGISAGLTIACMIGATTIGQKRLGVMTGLYSGAQIALQEYQRRVIDSIGHEKEADIKRELYSSKCAEALDKGTAITVTGKGEDLIYNSWTGDIFKSSIVELQRVENAINRKLLNEMYCSYNEFRELAGLPYIDAGEAVGWNSDHPVELSFDAKLIDDKSYIMMYFLDPPFENYSRIHY